MSLCLSGPVMSHSPNSQDSGGSDLDLDPTEAKLFPDGELFSSHQELGRRVCTRTLPAAAEHVLSDYDLRTNSRTSIFPLGRKEGMGFLCALGLFLSTEHGDGAGSGSELGQPGQQ